MPRGLMPQMPNYRKWVGKLSLFLLILPMPGRARRLLSKQLKLSANSMSSATSRARSVLTMRPRSLLKFGTESTASTCAGRFSSSLPVISETDGIVNFVDLIDGASITDATDEATGISSKVVLDWRGQSKNLDLKPRITLRDSKGKVVKKADDNEARYYLVPETILSVEDGDKVNAGDVLARLPKATSKTKMNT